MYTTTTYQSLSEEDDRVLEPQKERKQLPHNYNRGIPKSTYEPDISSKVRYPMSNYVYGQNLSNLNEGICESIICCSYS